MATSRSLFLIVALVASAFTANAQPNCNISAVANALNNFPNANTIGSTITSLIPGPTLTAVLTNAAGSTVLLPSNTAASNLLGALGITMAQFQALLANNPAIATAITGVLTTHVIPMQVNSSMLAASGSATTYNPTMNLTYTTGPAVTFRTPFSSANVTTPNQYVPGCSGLVVHVINTVLLPVAASALAPAVTAAVAALPSPPPPKSAATSFGNMAVLALAALVSAAAVAW